MNQTTLRYLFLLFIFISASSGKAQTLDCPYPIIFIHGFTGNQESFDGVYTNSNFINCFGALTDTYHAVLNATDNSNIWGGDGIPKTNDDDVLITFDNESNNLASGCVYAINFNNYWNEDEENPEIDINGCGSPGFFESDSNESSIKKGGYVLSDAIQKVLDANPGKEKVILVGHSMGGLTAREYLQRTENNDNTSDPEWWIDPSDTEGHKVLKLVTTSTPHRGSNFFGNPWPFQDPNSAETRDGLPDISSEATRDLRYSYSTGCGFLGLSSCPGAYLFGGEEDDIWGYWNEDVDCDGDESSTIIGINESGSPDEWDGTKDNPAMPLPTNIRYTWITSDIFLDSGDGVVSWDRQWLFDGNTPVPSDGTAHRLTDTILTNYSHLNVNSDANVIIRGLDEGDYPTFAWAIQLNNLTGGIVQVRSSDTPEGDKSTDPDWFKVHIPGEQTGDLNLTFNAHPALSGQIDFFNNTPGDFEQMTTNGDHQASFTSGSNTISLIIPEGDYTAGAVQYFRVIHEGIISTDWTIQYDFELITDAPLPVELISFDAYKMDDDIQLDWLTASEFNSQAFEIMRSFNGNNFETIGRVESVGFSTINQSYSFTDYDPIVGDNYYRLRQIDQDGKVSYSAIKLVYFEENVLEVLNVFPNPAREYVTIDYFTISNSAISFNIFNAIGQLMQSKQVNTSRGNNMTRLDISNLENGVYLLEMQQGTLQQFIKISKQ